MPTSTAEQSPSAGQRGQRQGAVSQPAGGQGQQTETAQTPDGAQASAKGDDVGDDGWETSTELPGLPGRDMAGNQGGQDTETAGQKAGTGQGDTGNERNGGSEQNTQGGEAGGAGGAGGEDGEEEIAGRSGELERALEDLDGEILAERIKAERAARTVAEQAGGGIDDEAQGGGAEAEGEGENGTGTSQSGGGAAPGRGTIASAMPPTPRPPLPLPPDTPDAKDDCVVARQIREAAMAETDPELRDALWKEYERYKSCR